MENRSDGLLIPLNEEKKERIVIINSRKKRNVVRTNYKSTNDKNYGKKGERKKEKEKERKKGSYFIHGRVTCLFRVIEQIYISLSPPVIPLSRCCRTLDSEGRLKG